MSTRSLSPDSFLTFGDLLRYLRRREHLTQLELSIAVGYSDAQITRLEKHQRRPDLTALKALFIPALHIENEPELIARFLELAQSARQEEAPAQGITPYKGLLFFDESDSELFFGRETLTAHLVGRVTDLNIDSSSRFLGVVGASGSGKSSLVRAGLAVALKQAGWDVRIFTPGAYPSKALEMQLELELNGDRAERLLILVDQFEETFTLCRDESERVSFIEKLLDLAQEPSKKLIVVIALRADFYSHCAQYPWLRQAVAAEQEYIGQMNSEELRRAIEEPAKRGGWEFELGLVDVLLNDIGVQGAGEPEPGALPLLSHALLATWEHRRGHTLTLEGYYASGGVHGAIAETAESVFTDQLNQTQQELARDVFLRLTELGEGTEDTRRRAALNELVRESAEATQLRAVLNTLAQARLITLNEDSAEVAHEALIREWQRLHEWLTQDREGLLLHRHLTDSAHEWESRGHDPSELYRGARLAQVREWTSVNEARLNATERAFLTASIKQEQHDALEREAQRQRELEAAQKLAETQSRAAEQLRRRAVYLVGVLVLAIVAALTASVLANRNSTLATSNAEIAKTAQANEDIALQERQTAQQQALIASVRELSNASNLNLEVDPERSILLALQAVNKTYLLDHTVLLEAEEALHRAVQASRVELTFRDNVNAFWDAVFSPDGTQIATASDTGRVTVWDAVTGKELLSIQGSTEGGVGNLEFSPNGKFLATSGDDNIARIWNATTGQELLTLKGYSSPIQHVTFSPNGTRLATISFDGILKIWDVATGKELLTMQEALIILPNALAFSPDGTRIAVAAIDGSQGGPIIWDAVTGEKLTAFSGANLYVRSVSFSPDGTRIVTTSDDRTAKIWDAKSGKVVLTLDGHTDLVADTAFNPDGTRLATVSWDGMIKIWDAATGRELLTLAGHIGDIFSVAFSPDGTRIVTASSDGTARVWNVSPSREFLTLVNGPVIIYPLGAKLAYSPDGTRLAVAHSDPTAKVWDMTMGKLLFSLTGHTNSLKNVAYTHGVSNITYNIDGTRIATSGQDGTAKLWDAITGNELLTLSGHLDGLSDVAFSPNGTRLATSSFDSTAKIWDANTGRDIFTLTGPKRWVMTIAFSPDGKRLATGYDDGTAIIWDAITGKELIRSSGPEGLLAISSIDYSPNGTRLAIARGFEGIAELWDAASGKELFTLSGHTGNVFGVAFSPDGKYLATAGSDKTVKLWDVITGKELLTLHAPDALTDVAFSPDGSQLATASRDGTTRIYLLRIEDLVVLAKQRITRSLTTEECQQYLHVATCPAEP